MYMYRCSFLMFKFYTTYTKLLVDFLIKAPNNGQSFFIWNLVLKLYFTMVYGQRITHFVYVALFLLCWTANNSIFLFLKFMLNSD